MSSKSYHPSGKSWREREAEKVQQKRVEEEQRKEDDRLKGLRLNDDNFPALSMKPVTKIVPETKSKLFASLASEWKEHDDVEKMREERRREQEQKSREHTFWRPTRISVRNQQSYYEEPIYEEEESHTPKYGHEDERWTTVEYKHRDPRKPRPFNTEENAEEEEYEQNADILDYDN